MEVPPVSLLMQLGALQPQPASNATAASAAFATSAAVAAVAAAAPVTPCSECIVCRVSKLFHHSYRVFLLTSSGKFHGGHHGGGHVGSSWGPLQVALVICRGASVVTSLMSMSTPLLLCYIFISPV